MVELFALSCLHHTTSSYECKWLWVTSRYSYKNILRARVVRVILMNLVIFTGDILVLGINKYVDIPFGCSQV